VGLGFGGDQTLWIVILDFDFAVIMFLLFDVGLSPRGLKRDSKGSTGQSDVCKNNLDFVAC
jgi:hypothetical protein